MELRATRIAITTAMGLLLGVIAGGAFDALQWPVFVTPILTGVGALVTVARRPLVRALAAVVALVVGLHATVWLAGGSLGDGVRAAFSGPRQLVTTEWPSPAVATVVGAVGLFIGTTTAVAAELAGRRRWHLAPLAIVAIGWAAMLAIGAPVRPPLWITVIGGLGALAIAATGVERAGSDRLGWRGDRTLAASAVAIVIGAVAAATTVAWADRADPRRTQEAELNAAVIDSVEAMVALRRADPVFEIFTIADRSRVVGQSLPARWRIAALDTYDGQRWVPELELRPIGGRLGLPTPADARLPPAIDYRLEYRSDDVPLLPFPGPPLSASVDVETDLDRVAVRPLERPDVGTVVEVESDVSLTSRATLTGLLERRSVDELADGFADQARRLGGSGTEIEQLARIESTMRDDWLLDRNTPGAGQQLALVERFVVDTNRGTREQFVTAFVLLARSLGVDARVATGFVVPPDAVASPLRLDSSMAATWPEVRFQDLGWVAYDPVPTVETVDDDEPPPQPEAQTPAAAQPPIAEPPDDVDDPDDEVLDVDAGASRWSSVRRWIVRVATVGALGLLPFAVVIGAIVGTKWWRRRSRREAPDPATRIRGVWANVTDALVDAGVAIAPNWTDDGIATAAAVAAPGVPHEIRRLAAMSTQMTFGSTARAADLADDAVQTARTVDDAIRGARTRWQRVMWWLSLRSLRRSTRSPVRPD